MNDKAAQQIEEMTLNGVNALLDVAQDQADSERNQQEEEEIFIKEDLGSAYKFVDKIPYSAPLLKSGKIDETAWTEVDLDRSEFIELLGFKLEYAFEVHVKIITPLNVPDGLIGSEMVDFSTKEEAEAYIAGLDNMLKMCDGISAISDILYDASDITYSAKIKRVVYPKM